MIAKLVPVLLLVLPGSVFAATAEEFCGAKNLLAAGKHAQCSFKVEARAETPDDLAEGLLSCDGKLSAKIGKNQTKALKKGLVCPGRGPVEATDIVIATVKENRAKLKTYFESGDVPTR